MNTLYNLLVGAFTGEAKDTFSVFSSIEEIVKNWMEGIGVPPIALYVVALVAAVGLGYFSYKLSKILIGAVSACVGYLLVGETLYRFLIDVVRFQLYEVPRYIFAGIAAVLFFIIGYKCFRYVFFALMGVLGYIVASFYISPYTEEILPLIGVAIIVALISAVFVRGTLILVTSFGSALVAITALSRIFPTVEFLQMENHWIACVIAGVLTLVFFIVQLLTTRTDKADRVHKRKNKNMIRRKRIVREY